MRSSDRNPGIRRASISGITSPRTIASYAGAFSGVVQPRQIRQVMERCPLSHTSSNASARRDGAPADW